jgi:hypothetical protein
MASEKAEVRERSGVIPLAIAVAAVVAIGLAYYFYVRDQRAYFSSRNLRLLATVADQLDDSMRTNEGFVRNYATSRDAPKSYVRGSVSSALEQSRNDPATYLPGFLTATRECEVPAGLAGETVPAFVRTLEWDDGEALLRIAYSQVTAPLPPVAAPNGVALPDVTTPASPSESGLLAAVGDVCQTDGLLVRRAQADVPLATLLEPIFDQSLLGAFDEVLLARGDGSVIFTAHQHTRSALSGGLSATGEEQTLSEQLVANLGQLPEMSGWRETKKLDVAALRESTQIDEVETAGGHSFLFTQPFHHPTVARDSAATKDDGRRWIVAGIVSKRRFMAEVLSVSTSIVLAVVALLLLMICAWPYLRVSLIGPHQRLTIADVLLLGFAALIHASILTLALLDVLAYGSLRAISDQQLQLLAATLETSLYHDLDTAVTTLRNLDEWAADPTADQRWPAPLLTDRAAVQGFPQPAYPYLSVAAWMDDTGMQRFKLTMRKGVPLVSVAHRRYFQDARRNRLLNVGSDPDNTFAIESVRSAASGETEAVIARPTVASNLRVVSATVELVDLTHAVLPPGVGFAVIDDGGNVVFHSEESRNNQENFFTETDWNRTVRSAVYGRQPQLASVRYWGADHAVYVNPLQKLPWTLIVFRNKSLLRTVNTEAVAVTLSMLLGNASIYLFVLFAILLLRPRYRAPQVWPLEKHGPLYARLVVLYAATIVTALAFVYAFDPRSVLLYTMLVPAQALLGTVLVLERRRAAWRWRAALAAWAVVNLLALSVLMRATPMRGIAPQNHPYLLMAGMLLLMIATAWATFRSKASRLDMTRPMRAYLTAGVLLLIVAAVVPTVGFFKVASRLEIEGLVKYTQLHLADRAEQAIIGIEQANVTDTAKEAYCAAWPGDPFRMRWKLAADGRADCWNDHPPRGVRKELDHAWLPDIYRAVLPAYSEESVSLRQLHGDSDEQSVWKWTWQRDFLTLDKKIHLPASDGERQAAAGNLFGDKVPAHSIQVKSRVPLSFAAALRSSGRGWTSLRALSVVVLLIAVAAIIGLLFAIVRFFAVKLFLIDLYEPLWLKPPPLMPTLGDHVLLIRGTKSVESLTGSRALTAGNNAFIDIRFETLDGSDDKDGWDVALLAIDREREGRNVRVFDFEYKAADARVSLRKLTFLERLLALPNRTVIVASTLSPAAFLSLVTNADLKKRWTAVLGAFVQVPESQLEALAPDDEAPQTGDNAEWLHRETAPAAFLRELRGELAPSAANADREQLIDELRERSNTYYAGLWSACSPQERILLHQLAREGLLNGKDRTSVRRLLARGLVQRRPNLRLFNETFRRYVLAAARREQVPLDAQEGPSAWDVIRLPLFVVFISTVVLVFATQKDMLNLATGVVAAVTTGLPAIVRLFGFFTERRSAAAETRASS